MAKWRLDDAGRPNAVVEGIDPVNPTSNYMYCTATVPHTAYIDPFLENCLRANQMLLIWRRKLKKREKKKMTQ